MSDRGKQSPQHILKRIESNRKHAAELGITWLGGRPPMNELERVWDRVKRGAPDECWPWIGYVHHGRGRMDVAKVTGIYVTRIAYLTAHPHSITLKCKDGKHVLHKCDNSICCNPSHMYLGDHAQNMRDKAERGRAPRPHGVNSVLAKLTEDDVRDIRLFRLIGATKPAIALLFGVSAACIKDIWQGRTYRNVS